MTTTAPFTAADAAADYYLATLRRETAALPRRQRDSVRLDVAEHLQLDESDEITATDVDDVIRSLGSPAAVARAGFDEADRSSRRTIRPSFGFLSKRLQAVVALIYGIPALVGLVILAAANMGQSISAVSDILDPRVLWQLAPVLLVALPPLLAPWTTWFRVSVVCFGAYALYLVAQVVVISFAISNVLAASFYTVNLSTLLTTHALGFILSGVALWWSPRVLRSHRAPSQEAAS
jgi:hypothetical protein